MNTPVARRADRSNRRGAFSDRRSVNSRSGLRPPLRGQTTGEAKWDRSNNCQSESSNENGESAEPTFGRASAAENRTPPLHPCHPRNLWFIRRPTIKPRMALISRMKIFQRRAEQLMLPLSSRASQVSEASGYFMRACILLILILSPGCSGSAASSARHKELAKKAYREQQYDKAIAELDEAIRLNPTDADAYGIRGDSWLKKHERDQAIADYDEAIRLGFKDTMVYNNRGIAWKQKKERDKAIADFNEALRIDPNNASAYYNRGSTWSAKAEFEKALADFDEAIRLAPDYAPAYANRAFIWSRQGEHDRALAGFDEAIRIDPQYADSYYGRAEEWAAQKEYDKALADYDEALRIDPNHGEAYYGRGRVRGCKFEFDKALADFAEAIRIDPEDPKPYNELAWIWATCPDAKFRDGPRAVESARKACELSDWKVWVAIQALAFAHEEAGDIENAIKYGEQALSMASAEKSSFFREWLDALRARKPSREE